ncbi:MAG: aminotransferase class V-fold PLP-dependent enzyme, partial [Ignavibacteriae bacterium]
GMTAVVNKFQRILGLRVHEDHRKSIHLSEEDRPVVFVSHMEHHSNQTSWLETIADVYVIGHTDDGLVDLRSLRQLLNDHRHRKVKIAAVTSCSNVTGIFTPYHDIAELMHEAGGVCFVDFACSAPYIAINMHPPERPDASLDAIYFSPHKFLGGPGSSGVLIFNTRLYHNRVPDNPGGGTVNYTNPWGINEYVDDIEAREDGGTPGFMQAIRTALCITLKDQMGVENMLRREEELIDILWDDLRSIKGLHVLADQHRHRLGVFSFFIEDLHYNLGVQMLNDRFGIQARGGCSCAGTYGHYLLDVTVESSNIIREHISCGDLSDRPGWIRFSIHPTTTDEEARTIVRAIREIAEHHREWAADYTYVPEKNVFVHRNASTKIDDFVHGWFNLGE